MQYLKYFENANTRLYTDINYIEYSKWIDKEVKFELSKEESFYIRSLSPVFCISMSISPSYNSKYNCLRLSTKNISTDIYKLDDDYYIVYCRLKNGVVLLYRCDTFEGLKQLIEEKIKKTI